MSVLKLLCKLVIILVKNGKSMNAWNNANNRCTSKKLYSKDGFVPIGVGNMEPS